jgi:hypothetical protein
VGKFPYRLLNGDVAFPKWEVNFGKQILISHFLVCLTSWFLAYLLCFCSIYLCIFVFECRDHLWSSTEATQELWFVLEVKRSLSCVLQVHCVEAVKPPPLCSGHQGRSNRLVKTVWPRVPEKFEFRVESFIWSIRIFTPFL